MHRYGSSALVVAAYSVGLVGCGGESKDGDLVQKQLAELSGRVKDLEARLARQSKEVVTERVVVRDPRAKASICIGALSLAGKDKPSEERHLKCAEDGEELAHFGVLVTGERPKDIGLFTDTRASISNSDGASGTLSAYGGEYPMAGLSLSAPDLAGSPELKAGEAGASISLRTSYGGATGSFSGKVRASLKVGPLQPKDGSGNSVEVECTEHGGSKLRLHHKGGNAIELESNHISASVGVMHDRGTTGSGDSFEIHRGATAELIASGDHKFAGLTVSRGGTLTSKSPSLKRAELTVDDAGQSSLQVLDPDAKASVVVGVSNLVDTKTGEETRTAPGLIVFGLDGKVVERVP